MNIWYFAAADDRPTAYEPKSDQEEHDTLGRVVVASTGCLVHSLLQINRQIRHEALDAVFCANRLMMRYGSMEHSGAFNGCMVLIVWSRIMSFA